MNDIEAEELLRRYAYWLSEKVRVDKHWEQMTHAADHWHEQQMKEVNNGLHRNSCALENHLVEVGKKSINLVNGRIAFRKQPDRVEIDDPEFWGSLPDEEFYRVKIVESPDKKAILEHLKETGEELPGVNFITGKQKFSVTINDVALPLEDNSYDAEDTQRSEADSSTEEVHSKDGS